MEIHPSQSTEHPSLLQLRGALYEQSLMDQGLGVPKGGFQILFGQEHLNSCMIRNNSTDYIPRFFFNFIYLFVCF